MASRLMLLDTASLYFRAFYGVPDSVRAPDGRPINAVRGLLDIITKLVTQFPPSDLVACWDDDWRPQWRVDLIPSYKAHRVAEVIEVGPDVEVIPDPLEAQVPIIRDVLGVLGIPIVGAAEHEADDVIGSLSTAADTPVDIITGDRDLFQLIDDGRGVRVVYTGRGMSNLEVLDDAAVLAKYGVHANQYAGMAALRGDASDGLPGVAGIGDKTAAQLLQRYGDLDGVLSAVEDPDAPMPAAMRAKLRAAADYLAVAPTVVEVVRDLRFAEYDSRIRPLDSEARHELSTLSEQWGLGAASDRVVEALQRAASS